MVYVRIELWPLGVRENARLLQEVTISNVGGDATVGQYDVAITHSSTFRGDGTVGDVPWKRATCRHRRNRSPAHLLASALRAALGGGDR